MVVGETLWVSEPLMKVLPPPTSTEVNTGKFWKLLGSAAAPWPLESLGVKPSLITIAEAGVESMAMPARAVAPRNVLRTRAKWRRLVFFMSIFPCR